LSETNCDDSQSLTTDRERRVLPILLIAATLPDREEITDLLI
jgi:hypothetical protein